MNSRSLVCFTLFIQSAIGLFWVSTMARWFGPGAKGVSTVWPESIALVLVALGLSAALAHLTHPRLAPKGLGNLATSWLSREVLLVPVFAGALVLVILALRMNASPWQSILETAACLAGGMALIAMTRVYRLKTVPVWNSSTTSLEFVGSALLLGGALSAVLTALSPGNQIDSRPELIAAASGVLLGLLLKLGVVFPILSAERNAQLRTWYEPPVMPFSTGQALALRTGLNLAGLALILVPLTGFGWAWLLSGSSLVILGTGEVIGRHLFYRSYRRVGL
jgi:anaerobic dimethyl sulfoxide reductase subunit C